MKNGPKTVRRDLTTSEIMFILAGFVLGSIVSGEDTINNPHGLMITMGTAVLVLMAGIRGILLDIRQDALNRESFRPIAEFLKSKPELHQAVETALKEHGYQPPGP